MNRNNFTNAKVAFFSGSYRHKKKALEFPKPFYE